MGRPRPRLGAMQEADKIWRARMADKIDICNHRLRVIQREA